MEKCIVALIGIRTLDCMIIGTDGFTKRWGPHKPIEYVQKH